jgi:SpoVK/Ycf46/Vps4 family AAA+-type ATPase
MSVK